METNQAHPFSHPFAHSSDYLPTEHDPDSIDSFGNQTPTHRPSYTNGGATDPLRRDGSSVNSTYTMGSASNIHGARHLLDSGLAADGNYRAGNTFPDSTANSIVASPSSGPSQFGYTNVNTVSGNPFGTLSTGPNSVLHTQQPQSYHTEHCTTTANIENRTGSGPVYLPPPIGFRHPSQLNDFTYSERDFYASPSNFNRFHLDQSPYPPFGHPHNSVPSASGYAGNVYGQSMPPQPAQNSKQEMECINFPFNVLEVNGDLSCNGRAIAPDVLAVMDKGFFWDASDKKWTCYRRNYFSLHVQYTLSPLISDGRIYLKRSDGTNEFVQAIGVRVTAAVDGPQGKTIELVQHTPKRDQGVKTEVKMFNLMPIAPEARSGVHLAGMHPLVHGHHGYRAQPLLTPGPYLPHQAYVEPLSATEMAAAQGTRTSGSAGAGYGAPTQVASPGQDCDHLFERIQFKNATLNNGKRRASQQFFHLVAELHVDTRKPGDPAPHWNLVAKRTSEKIVVRGRSPSHYQHDKQKKGPGGNSRGKHVGGINGRNVLPVYSIGQRLRSPGPRPHAMAGASISYAGAYSTHANFRTAPHYPVHGMRGALSDSGSPSDRSGSSPIDEGSGGSGVGQDNLEVIRQDAVMMPESSRTVICTEDGYRYFPGSMYGNGSAPRSAGQPRTLNEPRDAAFRTEFPDGTPGPRWEYGENAERLQGYGSSSGFYPDIGANYH